MGDITVYKHSFCYLIKFVTSELNKTIRESVEGGRLNFSLLQTLTAKVASVGSWHSFPFWIGKIGKYILAASDLLPEPPESLLAGYDFS